MIFLWVSSRSNRLGLEWLGIARSIQNYTWEMYLKERYGQVSFVFWIPHKERVLWKSMSSARLSLLLLVSTTFFIGFVDKFFRKFCHFFVILHFTFQILWLAKFLIFSSWPRCSRPLRFRDCWKSYILTFLHVSNKLVGLAVLHNYKSGIHSRDR